MFSVSYLTPSMVGVLLSGCGSISRLKEGYIFWVSEVNDIRVLYVWSYKSGCE